jgi:colanic acid biosynthesis glycosyl transferase WcaI
MRIIVWGINYSPELTGIAPFNTGLCEYLHEHGHEVEMITTFPYYPSWKKVSGDKGRLFRDDMIEGVLVHRCWHYVPTRVTNFRRLWHELSFGLTSLVRVLLEAKADIYVIISPPLLLGPLASFVCWLTQRPYIFHVQDLQPDAAVGLGMIKSGWMSRLLYRAEKWSYEHAGAVSGISAGILSALERKGVPDHKRMLFPNWIRWHGRNTSLCRSEAERRESARRFREKYNIPDRVFLATYSGNLGRKQGLETLVGAAALICRSEVQSQMTKEGSDNTNDSRSFRPILIMICGDGVVRRLLEKKIAELQLQNVRMMPILVESDYIAMLAASDVGLILQAQGTGRYFFPSKLLSMLSARLPVISCADVDSELNHCIAVGKFGINVSPENPGALADALMRMASDPERLIEMKASSRWVDRFAGDEILAMFEQKLIQMVLRQARS